MMYIWLFFPTSFGYDQVIPSIGSETPETRFKIKPT